MKNVVWWHANREHSLQCYIFKEDLQRHTVGALALQGQRSRSELMKIIDRENQVSTGRKYVGWSKRVQAEMEVYLPSGLQP